MVEGAYWSILVVGMLALLIPVLILGLVGKLGPRVGERPDSKDKLGVYECGLNPSLDARHRFSAKFYLVAVLFVLFDIEVAFLIPWAVQFRDLASPAGLGWGMLLSMALFLSVVVVGLIYVIRRGALEWE